ncbi:hypothetical protein HK098_006703 [Nowakowskiella sp. JEL0407]|nr:hypothetical protein HK098_006703 [Nowakowskiella sp. JEL0407]
MSRHSKNNTASSVFTHAERERLKYGTQKQRLGKESLRDFDACYLCLSKARTPLSCSKGHISCKECIYENMYAQKQEIQRKQNLVVSQATRLEAEEFERMEKEREKKIKDFEKTQLYGGILEKDVVEKKSELPSFWVPSLTPDAKPTVLELPKNEIVCTASEPYHASGLKKLTPIIFTESKGSTPQKVLYECPACMKSLSNNLKLQFSKKCGHVVCGECMSKFVYKSQECFVCSKTCKEKDIVTLYSEHRDVKKKEAEKFTVAFQ